MLSFTPHEQLLAGQEPPLSPPHRGANGGSGGEGACSQLQNAPGPRFEAQRGSPSQRQWWIGHLRPRELRGPAPGHTAADGAEQLMDSS